MSKVLSALESVVEYGKNKKIIGELDHIVVRNEIISILNIDYKENIAKEKHDLLEALDILYKFNDLNLPFEKYVSRIMGTMTPRNSELINKFNYLFEKEGAKAAIDWFYEYSKDIMYIRVDQVAKNKRWTYKSEFGDIVMTINLSKPEKDPRDIASVKDKKSNEYPKCPICLENIGYKGRPGFSERSNHRVIPLKLNNEKWYIQFSPYVYYNQHLIVLSEEHKPMKIDKETIVRLADFVDLYPDLFIGSNADLPIVGGSILNHNHFQGGCYKFPIEDAKVYGQVKKDGYILEILDWPVTTLRLVSEDREPIENIGEKLIESWKNYNNEELDILSHSQGEAHNTSTLVMRKLGNYYNLYISLRNNRVNSENPFGIFHAAEKYHHIKKENIGLIEVMGMAILPARLDEGLNKAKQDEMSKVFVEILKNCGVFKKADYPVLEKEVEKWLY